LLYVACGLVLGISVVGCEGWLHFGRLLRAHCCLPFALALPEETSFLSPLHPIYERADSLLSLLLFLLLLQLLLVVVLLLLVLLFLVVLYRSSSLLLLVILSWL